jgi:hypothetical protein
LSKRLLVKVLKELPGKGRPVSGKKTARPQTLVARHPVSQVVTCSDLVRYPVVGQKMVREEIGNVSQNLVKFLRIVVRAFWNVEI